MLPVGIAGSKRPRGEWGDCFLRTHISWILSDLLLRASSSHTEGRKMKPASGLTDEAIPHGGYSIEEGCSSSWVVPRSLNLAS